MLWGIRRRNFRLNCLQWGRSNSVDTVKWPNICLLNSGKKKAHKHKLFCPVVLGRPRVCPGDFTARGFVPGTNPVKTWDKPGASPYFTQWKTDFTRFVPGTNRFVPGTIPETKGGTESLCEKSLCAFFARYKPRFRSMLLTFPRNTADIEFTKYSPVRTPENRLFLTRLHGNSGESPVKIRSKSLEIMCFGGRA